MKVVELPVFTRTSSVLSAPPLAPRIEIYPIRRQENKVKVVFYSGYGNELSKPFSLTNSDNRNNNRILTSNYLGTENGLIEHNSITSVSNFEIYSAAREPDESDDYTYFTDRPLTSISTRATRGSGVDAGLLADSAATVLSLKTNKVFDINLTCVNTRVYTNFDVSGNSDSDTDVTVSVLGQTSVIPSGISDILDTLGD